MWARIIVVFLGGGFGAITREFSMLLLAPESTRLPLDILVANILASFVLGLVYGFHSRRNVTDEFSLLIATGFCGGMSTFSTFVYGAYSEMLEPGKLAISIFYILLSLVVGFAAAWAGVKLSTRPHTA